MHPLRTHPLPTFLSREPSSPAWPRFSIDGPLMRHRLAPPRVPRVPRQGGCPGGGCCFPARAGRSQAWYAAVSHRPVGDDARVLRRRQARDVGKAVGLQPQIGHNIGSQAPISIR